MRDIHIYEHSQEKRGGLFPAILSLLLPGLGQLLMGRIGAAIGHFCVSLLLWCVLLGWLVHIYSAYDAAKV